MFVCLIFPRFYRAAFVPAYEHGQHESQGVVHINIQFIVIRRLEETDYENVV